MHPQVRRSALIHSYVVHLNNMRVPCLQVWVRKQSVEVRIACCFGKYKPHEFLKRELLWFGSVYVCIENNAPLIKGYLVTGDLQFAPVGVA